MNWWQLDGTTNETGDTDRLNAAADAARRALGALQVVARTGVAPALPAAAPAPARPEPARPHWLIRNLTLTLLTRPEAAIPPELAIRLAGQFAALAELARLVAGEITAGRFAGNPHLRRMAALLDNGTQAAAQAALLVSDDPDEATRPAETALAAARAFKRLLPTALADLYRESDPGRIVLLQTVFQHLDEASWQLRDISRTLIRITGTSDDVAEREAAAQEERLLVELPAVEPARG